MGGVSSCSLVSTILLRTGRSETAVNGARALVTEPHQISRWSKKMQLRLATGMLFAIVYFCLFVFSNSLSSSPVEVIVCSLWLAVVLIALSVVDIETFSLPDTLVGALAGGGIFAVIMLDTSVLLQNVFAAITTGLFILAINWLYLHVRGRHGIGIGDAKLLAAGAIWLGGTGIVNGIFWACLTGFAHCLAKTGFKSRLSRTTKIPFGPHIALGIWLVWLFGPIQ